MRRPAATIPMPTVVVMPLEEERVVIERLQAGDRTAFATLYGWYGDKIYRQAILPKLPDRAAAEDVLRDTFRKALEKIDQGTFGVCDDCGEKISLKRLEARPETTLCIRCKEDQERVEKDFG